MFSLRFWQLWIVVMGIMLLPLTLFTWFNPILGVSYHTHQTHFWWSVLILAVLMAIMIKSDYWEYADYLPHPITQMLCHLLGCGAFMATVVMLVLIIGIRAAPEQIIAVEMGRVKITRGKGAVYSAWVKHSPNAPYLAGREFLIQSTRYQAIRRNPNVHILLKYNRFGYSVEVLP